MEINFKQSHLNAAESKSKCVHSGELPCRGQRLRAWDLNSMMPGHESFKGLEVKLFAKEVNSFTVERKKPCTKEGFHLETQTATSEVEHRTACLIQVTLPDWVLASALVRPIERTLCLECLMCFFAVNVVKHDMTSTLLPQTICSNWLFNGLVSNLLCLRSKWTCECALT